MVKKARAAQDLIANAGYPSPAVAKHLVEDGNIINSPITGADVDIAHKIYGPHPAVYRGKATSIMTTRVPNDPTRMLAIKEQILLVDIMHVKKQRFMRSTSQCSDP